MRHTLRDVYTTLRTEGALLPPDVLQRIAEADKSLPGLTPADYHCDGEKLNEAASRAWQRLQGRWAAFEASRAELPADETGTTDTRERWLLPLFQELGYGRLIGARAIELDGKTYPVSHLWQSTPIHLVGCNVKLDARAAGVAGAARQSPHSLVQELLNRSDDHLWAFVSNGLQLRILRDNVSLSRQAYVEFDLEAMMRGELYADFVLLWLLCHESRVEADKPEECWLERWMQEAQQQGVRALDGLRSGVQRAIEVLGRGFLAHGANQELLEKLRDGRLENLAYYRQLLRLVYRLLFLFTADDRDLLLLPPLDDDDAEAEQRRLARERFARFYSTAKLRELAARRRGGRHSDLYEAVDLICRWLGSDQGCPQLALPALGSFLFSGEALPDLDGSRIANSDLLAAVRALAFTADGGTLRSIDFRNLGAEELGSVYESLLEMQPVLNREAATFDLKVVSGSERKTTGSYYTPTSLIQMLLDSALQPVVEDRLKGKRSSEERAETILELKVCDPACGSGHFLIAAAHRLARHLAAARTGDHEPSLRAVRTALRDVIGRCIYGVDINPMAAELCKVNLWLEAVEPGKPLSFLDHHIQVGNSLLGATPELIEQGIPDEAFTSIEGDDKKVCSELRKRNKRERETGQGALFDVEHPSWTQGGSLLETARSIDTVDDSSLAGVRHKQSLFKSMLVADEYRSAKLVADTWCAVFVGRKTVDSPAVITDERFRHIGQDPERVPAAIRTAVEELAEHYSFFHWQLQFPDVFRPDDKGARVTGSESSGGFDVVLGNPPWDTLSPDQREFFGRWAPEVRSLAPPDQEAVITGLLEDESIALEWRTHCRDLFGLVHFLKNSGVYTLYAPGNLGKGDFNTYRMFVELALRRCGSGGIAAQIVPGGLYGGANASAIRRYLLDECTLLRVCGLINTRRAWFAEVDIDRFAAFACRRGGSSQSFLVQFGLENAADLASEPVRIEADLIRKLAPDTYAIPDVRGTAELATIQKMYASCPPFGITSLGLPVRHYCRELDMGNDRDLFTTDPRGLPVYEGRMIDHFDHRAKTYESGHGNSAVWIEREFGDPDKAVVPQWRVLPEDLPSKLGDRCFRYRIGFGDVANPRNVRSFVATLIPPRTVCGDKVPTLDFGFEEEWLYLPWLAVANSFTMDWLARCRLTSPKMAFSLLDGLPFPRFALEDEFVQLAAPLVLRLLCTAPEMTDYWNRMAEYGICSAVDAGTVPSPALTEPSERAAARAKLDGLVAARIYGLTCEELSGLLDTFSVLERRERKGIGEFGTKELVLKAFAELMP